MRCIFFAPGYNRGNYNQNRWEGNYRDGSSNGRGGYNRNQQSGGNYSRQAPYNKGYSQVHTHPFIYLRKADTNADQQLFMDCK